MFHGLNGGVREDGEREEDGAQAEESALQCVAVCCSVLQCFAAWYSVLSAATCTVRECVAVCCGVLQYGAV